MSSDRLKPEKISKKILLKFIQEAKDYLKTDKTMKDIFKQYKLDINLIDYIPTMFADLDVSAKTDHGIVLLNYKLLEDDNFFKNYSYIIHEYTHFIQQCFGDEATQGADDGNYLENKFEQEGFQNQIKFIDENFGEGEVEDYIRNLLDHHDVDKKDRKKMHEVLTAKI